MFVAGALGLTPARPQFATRRSNTMTRILIALALTLGTIAAAATPTLELSGNELRSWKQAEGTVYQADTQASSAREPRHDYPFTWNP